MKHLSTHGKKIVIPLSSGEQKAEEAKPCMSIPDIRMETRQRGLCVWGCGAFCLVLGSGTD